MQQSDSVLKNMGEEMDPGLILIDLQNVFDTPDHKIVLDKMIWFQSISNKSVWVPFIKKKTNYIVSLDNVFLEAEILNREALQRSFMRLLLF